MTRRPSSAPTTAPTARAVAAGRRTFYNGHKFMTKNDAAPLTLILSHHRRATGGEGMKEKGRNPPSPHPLP